MNFQSQGCTYIDFPTRIMMDPRIRKPDECRLFGYIDSGFMLRNGPSRGRMVNDRGIRVTDYQFIKKAAQPACRAAAAKVNLCSQTPSARRAAKQRRRVSLSPPLAESTTGQQIQPDTRDEVHRDSRINRLNVICCCGPCVCGRISRRRRQGRYLPCVRPW